MRSATMAFAAAVAVTGATAGPVWFTDGATVVRWHSATGAFARTGEARPVAAIAPTADGGAWVLQGATLARVDAQMTRTVALDLDGPARDGTAALAVDGTDGAWLATGDVVRRVAADGVVVGQWRHEAAIDDIAVGGPAAVFVAAEGGVTQYDAGGRVVRRTRVATADEAPGPGRLLLDRAGGYLWVVAGREAIQLDVLAGLAERARVAAREPHAAAGLDGASGTLWLATEGAVRTYDRDGRAGAAFALATAGDRPQALAADAALPMAWVGTLAGLAALNARTAQWFAITAGAPAMRVAVPSLALRPTLTPVVEGAPPVLRLLIGADCGDVRCDPESRYLRSLVLRAAVGDRDVSDQFALTADAGAAVMVGPEPGPAGAPVLVATVSDAWGVESAVAAVELPLGGLAMRPKANALPTVALTAPASNAAYVAPAAIAIAATASDGDGTITKVEFFRNGTLLATDTTAPYAYTWSSVPAGTYTLTAKAYDNAGGTVTSAPVTVVVRANVAPAVRITAPANGAAYTAPATVDIAVSATDSDGTVAKVEIFQGTTRIASLATAPWTYRWTGVAGGTYGLTAKATDDRGAVATSAAITIRVNRPPTASLTAPANGAMFVAPVNVTLQAAAADADGTVARVEFIADGAVRATDTAAPYSYVWSGVPVGTHTLAARVTDNMGAATTSAPVTITVAANVPPTVAITAPVTGTRVVAGVPVAFAATAVDADGAVARVEFFVNDGAGNYRFATDTTAPYGASYAFAEKTYAITAVATDNKGATTVSAPVAITAIANQRPAVVLTAPAGNATYVSVAPPDITLAATASDPDGTVVAVRFYAQQQPWQEGDAPLLLAALAAPPFQATWPAVPHTGSWIDGRYVEAWDVWAEATDDAGATASSDVATIAVLASAPRTVAITAPHETAYGGPIVFAAPATIVLAARASTYAGAPAAAKMEFLADGAPIGTVTAANAASGEYVMVWRDVAVGVRHVVARVTDTGGASTDSPAVAIRIAPPNRPPVVALTAPATGQVFGALVGAPTVDLAATASDADGTITSVRFLDNGRLVATANASPYAGSFAPSSGPHVIQAVAVDDRGAENASRPAFTYVPIGRRAPFAVVTSPVANSTVNAGTSITMAADVVAPDGTLEMVEFHDGPYVIARKTAPPWTHTFTIAEGVHALRVYALQAFAPDTMSLPVIVNAVGSAGTVVPAVELATPADGQVYVAPAAVALSVRVDDPQARVTRVDYMAGTQAVASATLPPFTANWSDVAAGTYELVAVGRFDGGTKVTVSPARTITVRQNAFVELTSPDAGRSYAPGDPVELDARAGTRAGVARIEFRADGNVLGSVAVAGAPIVATAKYTWTGATVGAHTVEARAYAADGTATTMLPVTIAVASLAVAVVEPYAGQTYYAPADVRIIADAVTGTGASGQVDFYGDGILLGSRATAPYVLLWTGVPAGTHTVSARARDASGAVASSQPVTVNVVVGASVQVDAGVDGSSVADDTISFGGTVVAHANAAVIVDGRRVAHDRAGRFFANQVALKPGTNVVTLVVNSQDVAPVARTITVTSTGTRPFRVWLSDAEGLAPFAPSLTISNRGNAPFQRVEIDMQDDGIVDATLTSLPEGVATIALDYPAPGTYTVRVRVFAPGGSIAYETALVVRAMAPGELAAKVAGVYRTLTERMVANDVPAALRLFVGEARPRYADIFAVLGASLPAAAAQLGAPIDGVITEDWAEVTIVRPTADGDRAFMIYLLRGADGLWRVESM